MNDMPTVLQQWLSARQSKQFHRQLLVISGVESWCLDRAEQVLAELSEAKPLWFGDGPEHFEPRQNKEYRQYLGTETAILIYNAFSGFRAAAASALSGTVTQGGLMLLLCPALEGWPTYADPEIAQRISVGFRKQARYSYFLARLTAQIRRDPSVALLSSEKTHLPLAPVTVGENPPIPQPAKTADQAKAVNELLASISAKQKSALVIKAHRGRGKSSALGIAAATRFKQGRANIIVTAAHPRACEQIFVQALYLLPDAIRTKHQLQWNESQLQFMPFDRIIAEHPECDALFIDEAASLPTPVLTELTNRYPKIAFATTVHGYEGSGRGFDIRFRQQLISLVPTTKTMEMQQPIRWHKDDCLEVFWFKACLLSANSSFEKKSSYVLNCELVSKNRLLKDESLLEAAFGLLVDAHYQTTPDDLQRLLDAPEQQLVIATIDDQLIAVAIIVDEPPHLTALAEDIVTGRRRPSGYLLSQSLAIHYQSTEWLQRHYWRVVRIATAAEYRQRGLASQLLAYIQNQAIQQKVDFLGTSFGMTSELVCFWEKNGYQLVKEGYKKDASSGFKNGLFLKKANDE